MTHSRRSDPAAAVEAGPAEAEATPSPAKPGSVSRMSHWGRLVSRMSHSRRPDRGRVGWDPVHGSGGSQVAEPRLCRNPGGVGQGPLRVGADSRVPDRAPGAGPVLVDTGISP